VLGKTGALEFADGPTYPCIAGFSGNECSFRDEAGKTLISFRPSPASFTYNGLIYTKVDVKIEPAAAALPELTALVLLGWWFNLRPPYEPRQGGTGAPT
jgi:hypothetical protein